MRKIELARPFKFSPNGYDVVEYEAGEHEVADACAVAAEQAGAAKPKGKTPPQNKATAPARNK